MLCSGYKVAFQDDGNFVVYNRAAHPIWESRTANLGGTILSMQNDGNLVIYKADGTAIWDSHTGGHPDAYLAVQNDGNVVIYTGDKDTAAVWWKTDTNGH